MANEFGNVGAVTKAFTRSTSNSNAFGNVGAVGSILKDLSKSLSGGGGIGDSSSTGKYIWRTMMDDRVRPEHAAREGQTFDDTFSPAPGEDYNCRCWKEEVEDDSSLTGDTGGTGGGGISDSDILGASSTSFGKTIVTSFAKTAAISFASSSAMRAGKKYILPKIETTVAGKALSKVASVSKKLPSIGVALVGYDIISGLVKGESVGEIAASLIGSAFGAKVGGKLGSNIFTKGKPMTSSIFDNPELKMDEVVKKTNKWFGYKMQAESTRSAKSTYDQKFFETTNPVAKGTQAKLAKSAIKNVKNALNPPTRTINVTGRGQSGLSTLASNYLKRAKKPKGRIF